MTIGPLTNRIWAYAGARLTEGIRELAAIAGGLVLSGDVQGQLADVIHAADTPVMLQHRLNADTTPQPTLFGDPDADAERMWLDRQLARNVPVVASRTSWLPNPGSISDPARVTKSAVKRCEAWQLPSVKLPSAHGWHC